MSKDRKNVITKHGLQTLEDDLNAAQQRVTKLQTELAAAIDTVTVLESQHKCDHPSSALVFTEGFLLKQTQCTKCKYVWFD